MKTKIPKAGSKAEETLARDLKIEEIDFQREWLFHATRRWRFDFAFPDRKLAVEIEGGIHSRGRHVRPKGYKADMEKYNAASLLGWTVIRVTPAQAMSGMALNMIKELMGKK